MVPGTSKTSFWPFARGRVIKTFVTPKGYVGCPCWEEIRGIQMRLLGNARFSWVADRRGAILLGVTAMTPVSSVILSPRMKHLSKVGYRISISMPSEAFQRWRLDSGDEVRRQYRNPGRSEEDRGEGDRQHRRGPSITYVTSLRPIGLLGRDLPASVQWY